MFKNYIKLAFKVMGRNKFFTFISLFGISFTLMVLIVVVAIWDNTTGNYGAESQFDRVLLVDRLIQKGEHSVTTGPPSAYFVNTYIRKMQTPQLVGMTSSSSKVNSYVDGQRINFSRRYVDANYWRILTHNIVAGRLFYEEEIDKQERVAVISDLAAKSVFGSTASALDKEIKCGGVNYKVVGIIEEHSVIKEFASGELFLPYTLMTGYDAKTLGWNMKGLMLFESASQLDQGRDEYQQIMATVEILDPEQFDTINSFAITLVEKGMTAANADSLEEVTQRKAAFIGTVILIGLLFMSLPAMNLININISRIIERTSEIGIRKSFGASSRVLVVQFMVENIILTLLGGLIGLIAAAIIIWQVNQSAWMPGLQLSINLAVLAWALFLTVLFGFLSGVYPAWRMSKYPIVEALSTSA